MSDIREILKKQILVIDGAMGTCLQDLNLTAQDFGGEEFEGCNENLNLTRPEIIKSIHKKYYEAGAHIVETNTFGGVPFVLDEYGLGSKCYEINLMGARLACEVRDEVRAQGKTAYVAGSIGPTTKAITVTGGIDFDGLVENFYAQVKALIEGDVDYFLIETCQDTRNVKAAIIACRKALSEANKDLPIAISGTIEPMGTMLAGQTVEALATSLEHEDLLYIGLNCATGPEFMTDHLRSLADMVAWNVACVPNAGLPDEEGRYLETPKMVGTILERFVKNGWANLLGGCCGTTYAHISEMRRIADANAPRVPKGIVTSTLSGIDYLEITPEDGPYFVGERTNVIGSRKFKNLIIDGKFEEAAEIAKAQVKKGAHIVDLCLANPDRDEKEDMKKFLDFVIQKVKVPLMIDSTDADVIEEALKYSQGKAIINSINLEDGEERFEQVIPIAKKYGAALVVGTIDDDPKQGMGVSRERKLEIAKRSYDLLVNKYGVRPTDIYWDPLVFPIGTGDENYVTSAVETIEGIKILKEAFPGTKFILGISNVSFGLPPAGREVLNTVYMYHCVKSGLNLAIVNTEKIKRYNSLTEEEIKLAEDLIWSRGDDPLMAFTEFFRGKKTQEAPKENLPLMERLPRYIIDGTKDGLVEDIDECLQQMKPLEIINGPLMAGMDVVGKLFNENKLIVAEVLQSAEAMKTAVAHLEPKMEKGDTAAKGKIVLATVKGDVHDIGKNLVDIILSNNGYEVVNLGIKITSEQLISAVREHKPDIVGLSGLLVKSAQQMVLSAGDLAQAGVVTPIMVGGAALSRKFVDLKISDSYEGDVFYAKDAMDGLELANKILTPEQRELLKKDQESRIATLSDELKVKSVKVKVRTERSKAIDLVKDPPKPTDFDRHVIKNTPIDLIWKYINPLMLYGRHLGMKGKLVKLLGDKSALLKEDGGEKALEIWNEVEEVKKKYKDSHFQAGAVYQFFPALSEKNDIIFLDPKDNKTQIKRITFPRQDKDDGLCLSDYVYPMKNGTVDSLGLFVVTVGKGIRELSEKLKNEGNFLHSHIVAALALESAEAYAEYLHSRIRSFWGHEDPLEMTMLERFQAKYHGLRYSFGYPACPRLDDQKDLFELLRPSDDLPVELTEGFMMDPESSVSALCFHHPQASYYSVGDLERY